MDQAPRGSVTFDEFQRIEKGMTRERVERIFSAGRGCVYFKYSIDGVRYVDRQYRQRNGNWTAIQYSTKRDGKLRVRNERYYKQWDTALAC